MKHISEFIYEGELDNIIKTNLTSISDEDITNEVKSFEGDNLSQKDILVIWNHLKQVIGSKAQIWCVPATADVDDYDRACAKWANNISKKYNITSLELENKKDVGKILKGIAWVVNGI